MKFVREFLSQFNQKNIQLISSAEIQTRDLSVMSVLRRHPLGRGYTRPCPKSVLQNT